MTRGTPGRRGRLLRWVGGAALLGMVVAYLGRTPQAPVSETRFLMDTLVTVTLWGVAGEPASRVFDGAFDALETVDREMARIPETPLWELNRRGRGTLSPSLWAVLEASLAWARRTGAAFDPTVAPLLDLWDIPSGPHPPPNPVEVAAALARVGWRRIRVEPASRAAELGGTALDFGGIAKGYALDRSAEALRQAGVSDFLVNAGGDLFVAGSKGGKPWRVAIQHPREPGAFLRVVTPAEGALVTSGDYERAYRWEGRRIHHILDPRTGYPAAACQAVSVWAQTAIDADALSTAAFVLGPEAGIELLEAEPGVEGLIVDSSGRVRETSGFGEVAPRSEAP